MAGCIAAMLATGLLAPPMASAATAQTIWGTSTPAGARTAEDSSAVELGTRFRVLAPGSATGVRFYKARENTGTHVGSLWNASGQRLGAVTFTNESASGWQQAKFDSPVALTTGETYTVSYHAPNGHYTATQMFSGASTSAALGVGANVGVYRYSSQASFPTSTWQGSNYWVDVTFEPRSGASPAPTATPKPTSTPTATPAPTTSAPSNGTGFPTASNTGVPVGTALSSYTGSCTVSTANTVIDSKVVNCSLNIKAKGVVIKNSRVNGTVYSDTKGSSQFTITDSEVNIGAREGTGLGDGNFTARRVHVTGGNRSVNCYLNCTIEDSYLHGQYTDATGRSHESGVRMGANAVIRHNTIACDAPNVPPDAGCSAGLTGYGDFDVVQNNLIDSNLFKASTGGYCAYGGSSKGKPFSNGTNSIRFTNNTFERGKNGKCGYYGPITSFDSKAPGNVWQNNRWDDGSAVAPAN